MIPENEVIPLKKWFAAVLLAALVLTGCGPKQPEAHEAQLFAMDTLMSLRIWGDEALVTQTEDTLRSLEALLSATAEDSDIARLNRDGTAELQPQTADLLQQALDCAARTGGAFDPTVYPLVCLWGFPSGKYHVPTEAELTGALAHTGAQHLQLDGAAAALDTGCSVDLGGIAKGYAAEQCAHQLEETGAQAAMLSLGGNVQTVGSKPDGTAWQVGIADPDDPSSAIAVVRFTGSKALVTSGDYQRYFEQDGVRYHHILDPQTGRPVQNGLRSVTILADSGTRVFYGPVRHGAGAGNGILAYFVRFRGRFHHGGRHDLRHGRRGRLADGLHVYGAEAMKTRFWILLFLSIAVVCAGLSVWLLGGKAETTAEVYSDGALVQTIDLAVDGEYRIESGGGWNILTVSGGKIAVTSASCPTQDCVHHAAADHGAPIVCLPNRLVVQFSTPSELDALLA